MEYFAERTISDKIKLVRDENDDLYIQKIISPAAADIYQRLKAVRSENIAAVYDVSPNKDGTFTVTEEYIDGLSLYDIAQKRRFSAGEVRLYTDGLCCGAEALHGAGIIHRDLTYNNILLSKYGVIKIVDFDISRTHKRGGKSDTEILGTPGFAAPEQYGFAQSDEKTDIYAIGSVMDFMLKNMDGSDKELAFIAQKCMSFSPHERFNDIRHLKTALRHAYHRDSPRPVLKALRYLYYFVCISNAVTVFFMGRPWMAVHISLLTFFVMLFPVMMFSNEFNWQDRFPGFKYARGYIKVSIMILVYVFVLFCTVVAEAILSINR